MYIESPSAVKNETSLVICLLDPTIFDHRLWQHNIQIIIDSYGVYLVENRTMIPPCIDSIKAAQSLTFNLLIQITELEGFHCYNFYYKSFRILSALCNLVSSKEKELSHKLTNAKLMYQRH